jgi:geranylgeranyl pyrophosphate synthase
MRAPDELRALVEEHIESLALTPELAGLQESMRYALEGGGKRIRPVICLATAEAAGAPATEALPAAVALELVHTFSLVQDDLPAIDDDDERRGRPTAHRAFGDGVALLASDALLTEAFRLALGYEDPDVARELVAATGGMIAGQFLDITDADVELAEIHRLKTGRLFRAAVELGLCVAGLDERERSGWHPFSNELGLLFQAVDDVLDGDGYVLRLGEAGARQVAADAADRARAALEQLEADTSVLREIVDDLAVRTT